jgi:hypothetical protein
VPPIIGGATPTIVPLSLLGIGAGPAAAPPGPAAAGPGAGGGPAPGGAAPAAGAGPPGRGPGLFIMSIVPLNLGAAAPFNAKLHFAHVVALSAFWVPQFGQNTRAPRVKSERGGSRVTKKRSLARRSIAASRAKNQGDCGAYLAGNA